MRVPVTRTEDTNVGFRELPPNNLKGVDRAILAVAIVGSATIVNATDSDWEENADLLTDLAIVVDQVCPQYRRRDN